MFVVSLAGFCGCCDHRSLAVVDTVATSILVCPVFSGCGCCWNDTSVAVVAKVRRLECTINKSSLLSFAHSLVVRLARSVRFLSFFVFCCLSCARFCLMDCWCVRYSRHFFVCGRVPSFVGGKEKDCLLYTSPSPRDRG